MRSECRHPIRRSFLRRQVFGVWLGVFWLASALYGCGNGNSGNESLVRTFNAYIPTAGTTSAIAAGSGSTVLSGSAALGFGQFSNSGSYIAISSGTFNPSATGAGLTPALQFQTPPTLNGNDASYTLVVGGMAGQTGARAPQLFLVPGFTIGQFNVPVGNTAIRVVNVSQNPNAVGLYTTTNGVPTAALNATVGNVAYGYSSAANPYIVVPTTQLVNFALVDVTAPGTALSLSTTSNLTTATFAGQQVYTLYIYGQPGNTAEPFGATWIQDFPIF